MKIFNLLFAIFCSINFVACGQPNSSTTSIETIQKKDTMDITKISNETVRKAIEALQNNDKATWYSYFTNDAVFTDDGRTMNFKSFFDNAFAKKEKFLTIDKIEDEGKSIYGNFFAGQWGTFPVFFKFHQTAEGKFNRLDIGQGK